MTYIRIELITTPIYRRINRVPCGVITFIERTTNVTSVVRAGYIKDLCSTPENIISIWSTHKERISKLEAEKQKEIKGVGLINVLRGF